MVQGIVTGVYIFHNSVIFIVLVRRFGLACPSSSVLTGTEIEIVVYCTHIKEESDRIAQYGHIVKESDRIDQYGQIVKVIWLRSNIQF